MPPNLLAGMTATIAHRGPDGDYGYCDDIVALGNRRLAILDLAGGAQPVFNEDRTVVVVYNGEIYNYRELRERLVRVGHRIHTDCDTEVLPHLYEEHGIEFVRLLNGIFAFALWDKRRRKLFLVRDAFGVKPLVFARRGNRLAFGSEAKAVLASGIVEPALDEVALHLTMNVRYVPGERTLFDGIQRVPAGHFVEVADDTGVRTHRYHEVDWTPDRGPSEAEWLEGIRWQLGGAVKRQLIADVPIGIALSGGVDSSAVVALARQHSAGELKTFTLGFNEPTDENEDARYVAEHFGTSHSEIVLHEPALSHLRDAVYFTEEPKVNCLQLYMLHRFLSKSVKVSLSGLGGDELFGGYDFYGYLLKTARFQDLIPKASRAPLHALARTGSRLDQPQIDLYMRMLSWVASTGDAARQYLLLRNAWDFDGPMLRRVYTAEFIDRLKTLTRDEYDRFFSVEKPLVQGALEAEFSTKMVNDLLHNEDTMSMAHSVESRVPLLDLEFVRFVARIPTELRFKYGIKGLFKKALVPVLPSRVLEKKKWGFTVDPVLQFDKDLRSTASAWLTERRLSDAGIFNPAFVRRLLNARPTQRLRWHYFMLWQMVGVEMWRDIFLSKDAAGARRDRKPASA
jgi:asparagine synthase (glutamine-hydrolysing)